MSNYINPAKSNPLQSRPRAGHSRTCDYSLYQYFKRDSCNTGILLHPGRNIVLLTSCALVE